MIPQDKLENLAEEYVKKTFGSIVSAAGLLAASDFKAGYTARDVEQSEREKLLVSSVKARLVRALNKGSGFTFEQEEYILLGAEMAKEALSEYSAKDEK